MDEPAQEVGVPWSPGKGTGVAQNLGATEANST